MSGKERKIMENITKENLTYEEQLELDKEWAKGLYSMLKDSGDKHVRYFNIRPIYNIRQMLEESVDKWPDRPAFYEKPGNKEDYQEITYLKLLSDVKMLGTALLDLGLAGEKVALIGENGYAWASAYLAIVSAGLVVVPIDKELGKTEISNLLIASGAKAVFYTNKYSDMMEEIQGESKSKLEHRINMGKNIFYELKKDGLKDGELRRKDLIKRGNSLIYLEKSDIFDKVEIRSDDLAALIFTSGTTGMAKGVMLTHKNIATELMIPASVMHVHSWDVFFSVLPLHHTYACTCDFLVPLCMGASIAYCQGLKYIGENMKEIRPTMILVVPLLVENMYSKIVKGIAKQGKTEVVAKVNKVNSFTKKVGIDLSKPFFKAVRENFGGRLRLIICGGAKVDPAVIGGIRGFGINCIQGYGLSECAPIIALNPDRSPKNDSAGYLVPGFYAKIDGADPETGIGEIVVRGDNVMLGYYNNQEATDEVIRDGWFYTGDYGRIDKDRYIYITGRKKSVIITKNGKNVFPEELEYLVGRYEEVESSMAYEVERMTGEDTLIAIAIKKSSNEVEDARVAEIVNEVNDSLPIHMKMKKLCVREEDFDMTTSKKIKRFEDSNKQGKEVAL